MHFPNWPQLFRTSLTLSEGVQDFARFAVPRQIRHVAGLHDRLQTSAGEHNALDRDVLSSFSAEVELRFPYFIRKRAPVAHERVLSTTRADSGIESAMMDFGFFGCTWVCRSRRSALAVRPSLTEALTINERLFRSALSAARGPSFGLEDLVRLVEEQGSCEVYSILKREDEKWVTEAAYANPKFVEDVTRDVVVALSSMPGVARFAARTESIESIHNHSAVAAIAWTTSGQQDQTIT